MTPGAAGPMARDLAAGFVAGLVGGLALAVAAQSAGITSSFVGIASPLGFLDYVVIAAILGGGFGALFRQQAGYAPAVGTGIVYGLLCWIALPLTLVPLIQGHAPGWSLAEASAVFPALVGYLLYGAITGLGFYLALRLYGRGHSDEASDRVMRPSVSLGRVVILGGGFAGVSAARRLARLLSPAAVDVTLVSQSNYLLFTPMLSEVASGGLEAQHISAPLRVMLPGTRVRRAEVESIDLTAQVVRVRPNPTEVSEALPFDHLVLALGAVPFSFGIPGVSEHAFTLKTLEEAVTLRDHVIAMLETADGESDAIERRRQLTFVVAGGGFAGTETIAELFDLVNSSLRYYPRIPVGEPRFVLIHAGDRILPEISAGLGEYALHKLRRRGIEFILSARLAGATRDAAQMADGRRIPTRTLVWTAGNHPSPLLKTVACERNPAGAVVADSTLRAKGFVNVWAVGDCAQIPDLTTGKPCPPTAQHAVRQGKVVAENIAASLLREPVKDFSFRTIGLLVLLGRRTAAAEVRGFKFSGLLAWFMWRAIYWSKLPGLEKKMRVALDWIIDLLFPRDIVLTGQGDVSTRSLPVQAPPAAAAAPAAAGSVRVAEPR
ncbi:MAG: NAD(P)/FAD-dependent oxidoreductase [Chloroflexi bacterium]|nr:MAG: NAD(P)/FAD-dependent oxidoreductase [Chloroflexota bacterium]